MIASNVFDESDKLAAELLSVVNLLLVDESSRFRVSDIACSLSIEHWHAVRELLRGELLPSAAVVHRAQFEAVARSIWLGYAATDEDVSKLTATLSLESEQAAKNMPQPQKMIEEIAKVGPPEAHAVLVRFKESSWKALNSYAHAGIHPMQRHRDGYPTELLHNVLRHANILGVVSCMHAVVLSGAQPVQRTLIAIAAKYPECMPPPL